MSDHDVPRAQPFEAILIHQVGKVGSTGLYKALQQRAPSPVFHTHVLHPRTRNFHTPQATLRWGQTEQSPHVADAAEVRRRFLDAGRPVAVITLVREPIARNVSAFFQNIRHHTRGGERIPIDDARALVDLFLEEYPHSQSDNWFARHLNRTFEVDVFASPFPTLQWTTLPSRHGSILVLRSSLDDAVKAEVVSRFLGIDSFELGRANLTENKGNAIAYSEFKRIIGTRVDYLDRMLALRTAQHFFTSQERERIKEDWVKLGSAVPEQGATKPAQTATKPTRIPPVPRPIPKPAAPRSRARAFEAVVIHQMGKVGSTSVADALQSRQDWPVYQTHVLNPDLPYFAPGEVPIPPRHSKVPPHVFRSIEVRKQFLEAGRKVAVVTLIREPIARNLSAFFQNIQGYMRGTGIPVDDPARLFDLFIREFQHDEPDQWFETEMNAAFDVDVYAHPFPEVGWTTIDSKYGTILILRSSLTDRAKVNRISRFLGVDAIELPRANVTEGKSDAVAYGALKAMVGRTPKYLDRMLSLKMAQHFFTPQEREAIKQQWQR